MKATQILLAIAMLAAGMLLGARLALGRAADGEPARPDMPTARTGTMLVHADETPGLQAARVDNHSSQAVILSNIARLLEPQVYDNLLAAVGAATRLPLMLEDEQVFLPALER